MPLNRRDWLATTGMGVAAGVAGPGRVPHLPGVPRQGDPFAPRLMVSASALRHNASALARLAGGRPILAMAKNNAYGLGLAVAGPLLEALPGVWGFGVVRSGEAAALLAAGVRKPVVLLGPASGEEQEALARRGVRLAAYQESDAADLIRLAARLGRPVPIHLYVDTGMHRMGMPQERVLPWLESADLRRAIRLEGACTELVEDQEMDRTQARRLRTLAAEAARGGVPLGLLHAASSDAILAPTAETFLDLLRPGLALCGGYPTAAARAWEELRPAYRLLARVIRVDRLEPGDGVSYHHRWKAETPTWTATLAIGHVDGYPAGAVRGCEVLIGDRLFPVVGTVSASHTVVALGREPSARVGDTAVLVGPDRPALHPNEVAARSGWSEYNMFMHLGAELVREAAA